MNFKQWIIQEQAEIKDLFDHIYKSINLMNDGKWSVIEKRRLMPTFRMQGYGVIQFLGKDARTTNDKFYVQVFYEIKKKLGPMEQPPEHYDDMPYEKLTNYDPKIGHKFLTFRGHIEGWKPGMMPGQELDYKTSAAIKGYPIPVSDPGDARHDMKNIDDFSSLTTPMEVAQFVKVSIDKFYNPGWDQDSEDEPAPTPREPAYSEGKRLPPWEKRKRIRKNPTQPAIRQARVYT